MLRTSNLITSIANSVSNPATPCPQNNYPSSFKTPAPRDQVELSSNAPRQIHFKGAMATQKLREGCIEDSVRITRPWPADCVKEFIRADDTPHVGNIPAPLLEKSGLSEPAFFHGLDQLALHLGQANYWQKLQRKMAPKTYKLGNLQLRVKKLGEGFYNRAFLLSSVGETGGPAYVLKIRKNNPIARLFFAAKSYNNSIFHDVGLGLFLTHHKIVKDVARHYAANPANPKAAWMLGEFISKDTKVSMREGLALYTDIPARVSDDRPGNREGYKSKAQGEPGVLCDLGDPWEIVVPLPHVAAESERHSSN